MTNELDIVDRIDAAVAQRSMLAHPFYQAWSAGELSLATLQDYARQYYHHVEAFPAAVSMVHAKCPAPRGRRMLAENLAEEEGIGEGKSSHAALWRDFAVALGVDERSIHGAPLNEQTENLIKAFGRLTGRNYAAGLGALYAYESQLPDIARTKIEGLRRHYGVDDDRAIRFFKVHEHADIEHSAVCRDLIRALPSWRQDEAENGAILLADALWDFLSGVQAQAALKN